MSSSEQEEGGKRRLECEGPAKKRRKQATPLRCSGSGAQSPATSDDEQPLNLALPTCAWPAVFPFTAPLLPAATPLRIFNPDAYCEQCNKEFCNKYFLKTHKANKHGIYSPPVPGTTAPPAPTVITAPVPSSAPTPTPAAAPAPVPTPAPASRPVDNLRYTCDLCPKKFCNKYFVRRHKAKVHGVLDIIDAGFEALRMAEEAESSVTGVETSAAAVAPTVKPEAELDHGEQSNAGPFSMEKLRKLGVINADAFCEICCKEYCNKYFLRTHKLKRHGIVISDSEPKESRNGSSFQWASTQTCPLNLIVSEQGNSSSDSADKGRSETQEPESECDICGRRFKSFYLMKMHRTYLHLDANRNKEKGISPDSQEQREEFIENKTGINVVNDSESATPNGNAEITNSETKDTISEDLQKLQTMILQLNSLNVNKVKTCNICNKDFENLNTHRVHMITEHGVFSEEEHSEIEKQVPTTNSQHNAGQTFCFHCKKDFFHSVLLKQHNEECHVSAAQPAPAVLTSIQPVVKEEPDASSTAVKTTPQSTAAEKRVSLTPTSSYCEICNKELCNKYFMKTHMQRMHGIEIENGAQIGGVICDICNKELCSKYFLRVHKQNTHGIMEEGASTSLQPTEGDPALKPVEIKDLSHRYFTHFTEACPICSRRFRSSKWLRAHLINDHGGVGADKWKELEARYQTLSKVQKTASEPPTMRLPTLKIPGSWSQHAGAPTNGSQPDSGVELASQQVLSNLFNASDSPEYHCTYCPFTTPVLALLFVHERTHSSGSKHQCPVCLQEYPSADALQSHLLSHQYAGLMHPFLSPSLPSSFQPTFSAVPAVETHLQEDQGDRNGGVVSSDAATVGNQKFHCSRCNQKFKSRELYQVHLQKKHAPSSVNAAVTDMPAPTESRQRPFKCPQCEFETDNMISLKRHVRRNHQKAPPCPQTTDSEQTSEPGEGIEMKQQLQDAATKTQVPASYAVPQTQPLEVGRFIMQPFLLEEPEGVTVSSEDARMNFDRKFVPSVVFLPVKERLSEPLTVSFTLTPA